ncbi:uncharacterized protein LOC111249585 isoform X2 [Varroa destructor]|uniref:Phosphatidylinositol N-acetylglucosaminyltransferase subunit Q n=1 Tax=Varroa destructor TaxID=109461 RepID=A0A7M7JZ85_VARDE|nr:uncharacterized protein LOC111249585 isoform X2 [Varroa destructor]
MLLVIHRDVLQSLNGIDKSGNSVSSFFVARPTPDHRNLILTTVDRRPRRESHFIGVASTRAKRSKCFDFTLNLDSFEIQSYCEHFTCDQVLIVEDKKLYEHITGGVQSLLNSVSSSAALTEAHMVAPTAGTFGTVDNQASSLGSLRKLVTDTEIPSDTSGIPGYSATAFSTAVPSETASESTISKSGRRSGATSYLEHHSALVKLVLVFRSFSVGKELLILLLLDALLGIWLGPRLCWWWPRALESAVPQVRRIVAWLRAGTPLGLKLNPQVNQALAKFFTCHVNMWHVYVDVMLPSLRTLTDAVAARPCLPLSVQCSLICDIITLATVHVYCFYGYMCKIYSVWLSALVALLRIFRGLKWNPLRQRVDSLADSDPVLLGPIILTILVFLSPTVFLYYVVFSIMRCCVLVVNFSLGTVTHDMHVLLFNLLKSLTSQPVINIRKTKIVRINEFALKAEASYSRGTGKLLMAGLKRLIRLKELLTFCRDLCVGKIVYPL